MNSTNNDNEPIDSVEVAIETSRASVRFFLSKYRNRNFNLDDLYQEAAYYSIRLYANGEYHKGKVFKSIYYHLINEKERGDMWFAWNKSFVEFETHTDDDEFNTVDLYLVDNSSEIDKDKKEQTVDTGMFFDKVIDEHFQDNRFKDGLYLLAHGEKQEAICDKLGYNINTFKRAVMSFKNFVRRLYPKYKLSQDQKRQ